MKIISWDPETKLVVLEKNGQLYKAKLLSHDQNSITIYIFNTNETITIPLHEPTQEPQEKKDQTKITSPIAGRIVKIHVKVGDHTSKNDPLVTIESMKMENEIRAPFDLFVKTISINESDLVKQEQLLLEIERSK